MSRDVGGGVMVLSGAYRLLGKKVAVTVADSVVGVAAPTNSATKVNSIVVQCGHYLSKITKNNANTPQQVK